MLHKFKRFVPVKVKDYIKDELRKAEYTVTKYICPFCNTNLSHFNLLYPELLMELDKYDYVHPLFSAETMNLLNYSCPACGSSDRGRLYAIYLAKKFEDIDQSKKHRLLDIGPDYLLTEF